MSNSSEYEVYGRLDFNLDELRKQAAIEDERLKEIQSLRQNSPLFMEDHDYLYRWLCLHDENTISNNVSGGYLQGFNPSYSHSKQQAVLQLFHQSLKIKDQHVLSYNEIPSATAISSSNSSSIDLAATIDGLCQQYGLKRDLDDDDRQHTKLSVAMSNNGEPLPHRGVFQQTSMKNEREGGHDDNSDNVLSYEFDLTSKTLAYRIKKESTMTSLKHIERTCHRRRTFLIQMQNSLKVQGNNNNHSSSSMRNASSSYSKKMREQWIQSSFFVTNTDERDQLYRDVTSFFGLEDPGKRAFLSGSWSPIPSASASGSSSAGSSGFNNRRDTSVSLPVMSSSSTPSLSSSKQDPANNKSNMKSTEINEQRQQRQQQQQRLMKYLPNHQIRQCFRRAGIIFECLNPTDPTRTQTQTKTKTLDAANTTLPVYDEVRSRGMNECLLPLLDSSIKIAQRSVPVDLTNRMLLVTVDDVLLAYNSINFFSFTKLPIYGFGCSGVRGLLASELMNVLHEFRADTSIDEVALSIVHDMVFSTALDVVKKAMSIAKYRPWIAKKVVIGELDLPSPSIGTGMRQTQSKWQGVVHEGSPVMNPTRTVYSEDGRSATLPTRPVDSIMLRIISKEDIEVALIHCIAPGDLRDQALSEMNKAIKKYQESATRPSSAASAASAHSSASSIGTRAELQLSPLLVLLALHCSVEFAHYDNAADNSSSSLLNMTAEALIGLTVIIEYLAAELFEVAGHDNKTYIEPTSISHVLRDVDGELAQVFPGIIRNGYVKNSVPPQLLLRQHANQSMNQCHESFKQALKESYRQQGQGQGQVQGQGKSPVYVNPFTGSFQMIAQDEEDDDDQENDNGPPDDTSGFSSKNNLEVLEALTKVPFSLNPQDENIFHRKIAAIESLSEDEQIELQALTSSLSVLYRIRHHEGDEDDSLPIFDMEAIHALCCYLYQQQAVMLPSSSTSSSQKSLPTLYVTMEACELIGCLLQYYFITLLNKNKRFRESFESPTSSSMPSMKRKSSQDEEVSDVDALSPMEKRLCVESHQGRSNSSNYSGYAATDSVFV